MRAEAGLVQGAIVAGQHTRMERWLRWRPIHEISQYRTLDDSRCVHVDNHTILAGLSPNPSSLAYS